MQVYMEQISDLIPDNPDDDIYSDNSRNTRKKEILSIREDPKTGIFVKGLKQIVTIYNSLAGKFGRRVS